MQPAEITAGETPTTCKKMFLTERVVKHWNRWSREFGDSHLWGYQNLAGQGPQQSDLALIRRMDKAASQDPLMILKMMHISTALA